MVNIDINAISAGIPTDIGTVLLQIGLHLGTALLWLGGGIIISDIVSKVLTRVFEGAKVEEAFKRFKVEDALGGTQVSPILVSLAHWYVVLLALNGAVAALEMNTLTLFINEVLLFAPKVIGVGLFVIAAAIVGEWVREAVMSLKRFYMQTTLAQVLRLSIMLMAIVVGLETIGFQMAFVREVFTLLLQGVVYGIAIAFGIAFGLGGQKDASDFIKKGRKRLDI
jgi:hypothetical protein